MARTQADPHDDGAEPLLPNPAREPIYASSSIQARRRRILQETRRMIAEKGIDGFSVRVLCRNADVAQRTLYNAFQSKDRLIAIAIRETYEDINRHIGYKTAATTLEGIIDRLISVNSRNLKARNYTKAVVSLYFSPTIGEDVWDALRQMVFLNLRQWLDRLAADGSLEEAVDVDEAAGVFANLEYSIINDWAVGRLSDEDYVPRLVLAVLSHAAGITRGPERDKVLAMTRTIRQSGRLPEFPKPTFRPAVVR